MWSPELGLMTPLTWGTGSPCSVAKTWNNNHHLRNPQSVSISHLPPGVRGALTS